MATFIESSFDVNETYEKTLNFMMTDDYSDYPAGIYSGTLQYQFDCVVNE